MLSIKFTVVPVMWFH